MQRVPRFALGVFRMKGSVSPEVEKLQAVVLQPHSFLCVLSVVLRYSFRAKKMCVCLCVCIN